MKLRKFFNIVLSCVMIVSLSIVLTGCKSNVEALKPPTMPEGPSSPTQPSGPAPSPEVDPAGVHTMDLSSSKRYETINIVEGPADGDLRSYVAPPLWDDHYVGDNFRTFVEAKESNHVDAYIDGIYGRDIAYDGIAVQCLLDGNSRAFGGSDHIRGEAYVSIVHHTAVENSSSKDYPPAAGVKAYFIPFKFSVGWHGETIRLVLPPDLQNLPAITVPLSEYAPFTGKPGDSVWQIHIVFLYKTGPNV